MAQKSTMLFDVLGNILQKKSLELYQKHIESEYFKDAAAFMVRKYLSMHLNSAIRQIIIDNQIQLERMPDAIQYLWLLRKIPRQKSTFINFIR